MAATQVVLMAVGFSVSPAILGYITDNFLLGMLISTVPFMWLSFNSQQPLLLSLSILYLISIALVIGMMASGVVFGTGTGSDSV